jgi:hypothetical protein
MDEASQRMRADNYVREAVAQLFTLKARTGSGADLKQFANRCITDANRKLLRARRGHGLDIHRLGSVLRAWHTEARYLSDDGAPRALKRAGRNSLKSLIQIYYRPNKVSLVFSRLRAAKLIRRSGRERWLPTGKHARISQLSFETLEHLSEGVARYVETVTNTVTATRSQDVLFERSCKVTRLPSKEYGAFRNYVHEQAIAFITAIDDWLESRNVPPERTTKGLRTAGVYTFAYIDRKR